VTARPASRPFIIGSGQPTLHRPPVTHATEVTFWGFKDLDDVAAFFDQADADYTKELAFDELASALDSRSATGS